MKTIKVDLSEEQVEILEKISHLAGRNSSEFIKDTIFSLLPMNEYMAIQEYVEKIKRLKQYKNNQDEIQNIAEIINDIELSANARLKRIGVL